MARKEKKYHYIYKITCLKNERYYIGMHSTDNLEDGYMGGGKRIKNSVKKHGKDAHRKEILEFFENRKDLSDREIQLINEELLNDPLCMNIALGGGNFVPIYISDELHKQISRLGGISLGNKILKDPEYSKIHSENSSKIMKDNHKNKKIKYDTFKNKRHTDEARKKIGEKNSKNQLGNKNSQYGTIWITNGLINKKIKGDSDIPENWIKGRI